MACVGLPGQIAICATSAGSKYRLMLPVVVLPLTKCKTSKNSVRIDGEEKNVSKPPPLKAFILGLSHCCRSSAPVVNYNNIKAAETDTWTGYTLKRQHQYPRKVFLLFIYLFFEHLCVCLIEWHCIAYILTNIGTFYSKKAVKCQNNWHS